MSSVKPRHSLVEKPNLNRRPFKWAKAFDSVPTGHFLLIYYIAFYMAARVRINKWHAVAEWSWKVDDENCGICRNAFNACPPGVKYPGDDCPPGIYSFISTRNRSNISRLRPRALVIRIMFPSPFVLAFSCCFSSVSTYLFILSMGQMPARVPLTMHQRMAENKQHLCASIFSTFFFNGSLFLSLLLSASLDILF